MLHRNYFKKDWPAEFSSNSRLQHLLGGLSACEHWKRRSATSINFFNTTNCPVDSSLRLRRRGVG